MEVAAGHRQFGEDERAPLEGCEVRLVEHVFLADLGVVVGVDDDHVGVGAGLKRPLPGRQSVVRGRRLRTFLDQPGQREAIAVQHLSQE